MPANKDRWAGAGLNSPARTLRAGHEHSTRSALDRFFVSDMESLPVGLEEVPKAEHQGRVIEWGCSATGLIHAPARSGYASNHMSTMTMKFWECRYLFGTQFASNRVARGRDGKL
jgi:hypothetical protein